MYNAHFWLPTCAKQYIAPEQRFLKPLVDYSIVCQTAPVA